ncbi:ABC transporter substrate-binding protein [Aerococcus kribbianus]|uniref:ABC transporter substrate-binding protein n=1 Tax=Aerococcus kribbianus TaxID=2999064 RepID=A0A9X3FMT3_9LACT|nr:MULTISPECIES: ABC transporter substrate-binding protein [unclassified Aerococcus]MCZ0717295.1 ABC transporter substrate-binding protein [Aerococcus sp. YH-aer221]MCZ0725583.1 ABC transporter substrate-binding protein [Aerococcus sp. YH-aer222]
MKKQANISSLAFLILLMSFLIVGCEQVSLTDPDNPDSTVNKEAEVEEEPIPTPREMMSILTQEKLSSLNPNKVVSYFDASAMNMAYEGLYRLNKDGEIIPANADGSIKIENNLATISLQDSQWSNGQAVTAEDYVYSWQQLVNPQHNNPYKSLLTGKIAQAQEIVENEADIKDLGVRAIDDKTLEITLADDTVTVETLEKLLSLPQLAPLPKDFIQKVGYDDYGSESAKTLFNGPYTINGWSQNWETWQFVNNAEYANNAKLSFPSQSISYTHISSESLAEESFTNQLADITYSFDDKSEYPNITNYSLIYNQSNPDRKETVLANEELRAILSQAINKNNIVKRLEGNYTIQSANSLNPSVNDKIKENNDTSDNLDQEFNQLLDELDYQALELNLLTDESNASIAIANTIKDELENNLSHLVINIKSMPIDTQRNFMNDHDFDISLISSQNYFHTNNSLIYSNLPINVSEVSTNLSLSDTDVLAIENKIINNHTITPIVNITKGISENDDSVVNSPYRSQGFLFDFENTDYDKNETTIPIPTEEEETE